MNENVRADAGLKTALNANQKIKDAIQEQITALTAVATKLGFSLSDAGVNTATITSTPFPIPYTLWGGHMAFDTTSDGESDNRAAFAKAATKIRREAVKVRLAFKELRDATKKGGDLDPGGTPAG